MILFLEILRGLAALWVFLFHVSDFFVVSSPFLHGLAIYGFLGVPMFFVISGYVITCSAEASFKRNRSPFSFLKARFLRIYPTFWASLAIVILSPTVIELLSMLKTGVYVPPASLLAQYTFSEWIKFLSLVKVFWASSHDLQSEFNKVNSVYWTIAIEFQFYLVVFFAMFFKKYFTVILLVISIISMVLLIIPFEINYGLFIHYWPSFSIGIGLAYVIRYKEYFKRIFRSQYMKLFSVLIVLSILVLCIRFPGPKNIYFALSFGFFLLVASDFEVFLIKVKKSNIRVISWILEPFIVMGAMSYTVYLLHGKIYLIPNMFVRQMFPPASLLNGVLTIFGTLILCYPFYYFIERRFMSKNYIEVKSKIAV